MANYVVFEVNGSVTVCVSLAGYIERSVFVTVITLEGSAVGECTLEECLWTTNKIQKNTSQLCRLFSYDNFGCVFQLSPTMLQEVKFYIIIVSETEELRG